MKLPDNIEGLIRAQNKADSTAFAAYFTNLATVFDVGSSYSGQVEIQQWIQHASEKYQMQLKPVDFNQTGSTAELTVAVSGTFPGSPAVMQYHLELDGAFIRSLRISG
ncbi:nuclear transport factor 2 family protein [Fibrella aquatica]|jgi:hypothetical protein|uniref:nuclear transport factor 2 family protein n=1 Tax=Fibrella aquatica TaxID=3242487 RepID=UPI003522934D